MENGAGYEDFEALEALYGDTGGSEQGSSQEAGWTGTQSQEPDQEDNDVRQEDEEAIETIREELGKLDLKSLQKVGRLVEKEQKRCEKEARKQAEQEMREVAQRYGLSMEELMNVDTTKKSKGKSQGKVPPKFRHPEDPSKTWTGRGRKPKWVQAWEEEGGDLESLRIPEGEASS